MEKIKEPRQSVKHVGSPKPTVLKTADELCSTFMLYMEARGGQVGLNSCDFRRVKAKTKCSAWDEMEAMADGLVFTAPTRKKRPDKKPFVETFPSDFIGKPAMALSPWQRACVRRPVSP